MPRYEGKQELRIFVILALADYIRAPTALTLGEKTPCSQWMRCRVGLNLAMAFKIKKKPPSWRGIQNLIAVLTLLTQLC